MTVTGMCESPTFAVKCILFFKLCDDKSQQKSDLVFLHVNIFFLGGGKQKFPRMFVLPHMPT